VTVPPIQSGAAAGNSAQGAAASATASLLDPNTFLTLLVDELKYQNPLQPTNSSTFMSQIAQLSQVEQLQTVSTSSQVSEAEGLIGKTVIADVGGQVVTGTVGGVVMSTHGPLLDVAGVGVALSAVTQISAGP
jgi:flagellar basal-body rod modification protein FlgD